MIVFIRFVITIKDLKGITFSLDYKSKVFFQRKKKKNQNSIQPALISLSPAQKAT